MIAAISLMRRRDDVPLGRFRRHWLDVHGPLVCAFPGLKDYVQLHVLDSPATNAAARAMRIDGFPILVFDSEADRKAATGSPEMAACNVDSQLFIGAVARVMSRQDDVEPITAVGRARLLVLYPQGTGADEVETGIGRLRALPRHYGLRRYTVLGQGRAPASVIPHLEVPVAAAAQVWFESMVELEGAVEGLEAGAAATFATEEHRLV